MRTKKRLEELRKQVENIEISYDLESTYCDLINATIDYQNETQDWEFDYIFESYIDDFVLVNLVKDNLERFGIWAVRNLLNDIKNENGIYKIDEYGYGHDVTSSDLEDIKKQILDEIDDLESEED